MVETTETGPTPEQPKVSLYEVLTDAQRDAEWREARDEQRQALADQRAAHAEWQKALAWQSDVFLLIAECLVALVPYRPHFQERLEAARAALTSEAHREDEAACDHVVWGNSDNSAVINGVCHRCDQRVGA